MSDLGGSRVVALFEDREGDLWVGTDNAGLLRFGTQGVSRYGRENGLTSSMPRVIHEDARGTIWVGTLHGVFRLSTDGFHLLASDPGLAGDTVNTMEELADGSLWVGTTTGLARIEGEKLIPEMPAGQRIRSDVTALRAEPDGSVWIGTVGEGLARLSRGKLERVTQREGCTRTRSSPSCPMNRVTSGSRGTTGSPG